jgi:hypothetical protein
MKIETNPLIVTLLLKSMAIEDFSIRFLS